MRATFGKLFALLLGMNVLLGQQLPTTKKLGFKDLIDIRITPSETHVPLHNLRMEIPAVFAPKPNTEIKFLKAEILLNRERYCEGIIGFRKVEAKENQRIELSVNLTKNLYAHSTARIYYGDGTRIWTFHVQLNMTQNKPAQQDGGGKRE